jgi:uncharacterized protein YdaU (DUF1376 family)
VTKQTFELPWYYRQVPRDFMSSPDVEIMTCEEVGSYFLLLQKAWLGGENCTLPNDPARLAKLARVEKVSELVLSKFMQDKDGRLFNERLKSEWDFAVKRSKDASKAAKKSHATGLRSQSGRSTTAMPAHSDGTATKTKTQTQNNTKTKLKTMQGHTEAGLSTDVGVVSAAPSEPARRVAGKLAEVLGRTNLKPATVEAWAREAESVITSHGEQVALDVMQSTLVANNDGFWRGRIYGMKNFVRCFNSMHEQAKRKTAGLRAAVTMNPLAARATSLNEQHDFASIAKGDL